MECVRDGNWSVWEVLEMDSKSVGDLERRVFVEMLELECVEEKEIVFKQFLYRLKGHAGYHFEYLAGVGSTKKGKK